MCLDTGYTYGQSLKWLFSIPLVNFHSYSLQDDTFIPLNSAAPAFLHKTDNLILILLTETEELYHLPNS